MSKGVAAVIRARVRGTGHGRQGGVFARSKRGTRRKGPLGQLVAQRLPMERLHLPGRKPKSRLPAIIEGFGALVGAAAATVGVVSELRAIKERGEASQDGNGRRTRRPPATAQHAHGSSNGGSGARKANGSSQSGVKGQRERDVWEMAGIDKAKNVGQRVKGKAKEAAGTATGNDRLRAKGKSDQAKSHAKQAGEKVKDALKS